MVMPQTCETMAQVHYEPGCGLHLVLSGGQVFIPQNVKFISATEDSKKFTVNGFEVEAGQQIIIGYKPVAGPDVNCGGTRAKPIEVDCIVGFKTRSI